MASELRVLEDGVPDAPSPPRPVSAWVFLVVGFGLGLGIGVVFATSDVLPAESAPGPGTPVVASGGEEPTASLGISETVEGFPDTLVTVVTASSDTFTHLVWPSHGSISTRAIPGGDSAAIDASGLFLAVSGDVPGVEGELLSAGRPGSVHPLAVGATSYAWHDSRPARISYTTGGVDGWALWVAGADLKPNLVVQGVVETGAVAAWGDWGWAIQTVEDEIALLTPSGAMKALLVGTVFSSHPDGWVVVAGDSIQLVSAGGGVKGIESSLMDPSAVTDASISPDGSRVAISGEGVEVIEIGVDGGSPATFDVVASGRVRWSSDSRFLIVPGPRGLNLLDVDSGAISYVLNEHTMLVATVVPLASP